MSEIKTQAAPTVPDGQTQEIEQLREEVELLSGVLANKGAFRELAKLRKEFADDRRAAMEWLEKRLENMACLTPGAHYASRVSRRRIEVTVDLPESLAMSDYVCESKNYVIHSYLQQAVRVLAVQSGHYDGPMPASLIPDHPSDEESFRIIREFAALSERRT